MAIDGGRLFSAKVPRLTVLRDADRQVVVVSAELPADPGERINGGPTFSNNSSQLAAQVSHRLRFGNLSTVEPLDAALTVAADYLAQANPPKPRRYR